MRLAVVLYTLGLFALSAAQQAQAQAGETYERITRAEAISMDAYIVPQCAQGNRQVRRVGIEESAYRMKGDRDRRNEGTRIFIEHYEATGCGQPTRRLNIQVFDGGSLAPSPISALLPPGGTAISHGIMADVFRQQVPMLMATRHSGCRTSPDGSPIFLLTDTNIVEGVPFTTGGAWAERWSYRACDTENSVDIVFSYDGDGVVMIMRGLMMGSTPVPTN
ncbi:MAG TPA: hypothetical protein DHW63_01365 [Hyphomonadaceae bacterium]|nr:hypothetical protein [Hyphomonadaceae bacterium]